jgi:hypothetical protein
MADEKVIIEIVLDKKDAVKYIDGLKNNFKKAGEDSGDNFSGGFTDKIKNGLKGVGGLVAGYFAISGVTRIFSSITEAAGEQEQAVRSLTVALNKTGEATRIKEFENFAASLQKVTAFGDEAILSQLAFAIQLGATSEQSKKILSVSVNLAEALNISLESAVRNVTKTLGGLKGELGEVIPELGALSSTQLKAGAAIDVLDRKFSGVATDSLGTYRKATEQLGNAWGDLLESFGAYITQSETVNAAIRGTTSLFSNLAGLVAGGGTDSIVQRVIEINKAINNLSSSLKDPSSGGFQIYNQTLQADITRLEKERDALISQLPKEGGIGPITPSEFQKQENERLRAVYADRTALTIAALNELGIQTDQQQFDESVRKQEALLLAYDRDLIDFEEFQRRKTEIEQQYIDARYKIGTEGEEKKNKKIIEAQFKANDVLGNIVASGVQTFARNIIEGQNIASSFGKLLLNTFGDLATQLGTFFVATGIAKLGLFATDPTGTSAGIAAGVALIGFGQIMKAFASGGAGGASYGSSQGMTPIGPSYEVSTPTEIDDEEIERATPKSNLVINVQGDIVSEDEFGTRLVNLINKSIDNTDIKLRQGAFA